MEVRAELIGARGWSTSLRFLQQSVSLVTAAHLEIMSSSRLEGEALLNISLIHSAPHHPDLWNILRYSPWVHTCLSSTNDRAPNSFPLVVSYYELKM